MERKKLKKYKMAVGICGPTVLYTNIYKAYTVEEAVQMYFRELGKTPTDKEYDEALIKMREIVEEKPLESYLDSQMEELNVGDEVLAIVKKDGSRSVIVNGIISSLTKRGIKIKAEEKEFLIRIGADDYKIIQGSKVPFFSKLVKTSGYSGNEELNVGDTVAFITSAYMNSNYYFSFGTVADISPSYVFIDTENEQVKKSKDKVRIIKDVVS